MRKIIIIILFLIFSTVPAFTQEVSNEARLEYNEGIDYYKLGQYDKALAAFRRAVSISPDYIDAYYNLGSILEYLKQYDQALNAFKQIILRDPEDYESIYKAAVLASQIGDNASAIEYLKLIPKNSSVEPQARQLIMRLQEKIGSPDNSKAVVKSINSTTNLFENIPSPTGVVTDIYGNLYVANFVDNSITKIATDNTRSTYVKSPKLNGPIGMAIDLKGNIYVANYNANNVVKISKNKEINVLIGNLKQPYGLYLTENILYISLQGMHAVLRYKLAE